MTDRHFEVMCDEQGGLQAGVRGRPSLVLVLGMHRSGTSAATGLLCEAGGWVGESSELISADELNPVGYFERRSTAGRLDEMLADLGGTWHDPPLDRLESPALEAAIPQLQWLLGSIIDAAPSGTVPIVKDPRLSLFAPLIPSVMRQSSAVVVCIRHPLKSARSLSKAQYLPLPAALALWETYNAVICSGLSGVPVHVFQVEQVADKPIAAVTFVQQVLGQELPPGTLRKVERFVTTEFLQADPLERDETDWLTVAPALMWRQLLDAAAQSPTFLPSRRVSASARWLLDQERARRSCDSHIAALERELARLKR